MVLRFVLFSCSFFKQKTAYEIRISDWSSDVCSSDLTAQALLPAASAAATRNARYIVRRPARIRRLRGRGTWWTSVGRMEGRCDFRCRHRRSEEHTSELQSLMRISYAVFCLKKKRSN